MNIKELAELKKLNYDCELFIDILEEPILHFSLLKVNFYFSLKTPPIFTGKGTLLKSKELSTVGWEENFIVPELMENLSSTGISFVENLKNDSWLTSSLIRLAMEESIPNCWTTLKIGFPDSKGKTTMAQDFLNELKAEQDGSEDYS